MEAYPNKLRELVLDAYEEGLKTAQIARRFKVSRSWARRVKQRWHELKVRIATRQKHGANPKLSPADRRELAELVDKTPDATLMELKQQLTKPVSISTLSRTLIDMKLTLKKSRFTPVSRIDRT